MWATCPRVCKAGKLKKPGSYNINNWHGGVMPGWPNEHKLTNKRVSKIMRACIQSRKLTYSNLEDVRKCLSYLWETTGQKTKLMGNWPAVGSLWDSTVRLKNLKPKKAKPPMRIPDLDDLKTAILKGWTPGDPNWPLMKHCVYYGCFWDSYVLGLRPNVDTDKVKKSTTHNYNWSKGWQCTDFVDGRAKLTGVKRGCRPWKSYRICLCKGDKHIRPAEKVWSMFDDDGNPSIDLARMKFDPRCPLACTEVIWQCQLEDDVPKRQYPNWIPRTKFRPARLGALNVGDPAEAGLEWLEHQGVGRFDHNAGRKSLAGWCRTLKIPYRLSVHIHGDLYDVWIKHYQFVDPTLVADAHLKIRDQSLDPKVATAALSIFAKALGRGFNHFVPTLSLRERQGDFLVRKFGGAAVADNLVMGLEAFPKLEKVEPDEEPDNTPWVPPMMRPPVKRGSRSSHPRECRKRARPFGIKREQREPGAKRQRTLRKPQRAVHPLIKTEPKDEPMPKPSPKPKPQPKPSPSPKPQPKPKLRIRLRPKYKGRWTDRVFIGFKFLGISRD